MCLYIMSETVQEPWSTGCGGSSDATCSDVARSTSSCPGSSPDTENALCGQSSGTFSAAAASRNVETKADVETNTWRGKEKGSESDQNQLSRINEQEHEDEVLYRVKE